MDYIAWTRRLTVLGMAALVAMVLSVGTAKAATITVTNLNDSGANSLRQRITDASAGDTIDFSVTGTITLATGPLTINKNLNIIGPTSAGLTVDGNSASEVFNIGGGTTVTLS